MFQTYSQISNSTIFSHHVFTIGPGQLELFYTPTFRTYVTPVNEVRSLPDPIENGTVIYLHAISHGRHLCVKLERVIDLKKELNFVRKVWLDRTDSDVDLKTFRFIYSVILKRYIALSRLVWRHYLSSLTYWRAMKRIPRVEVFHFIWQPFSGTYLSNRDSRHYGK